MYAHPNILLNHPKHLIYEKKKERKEMDFSHLYHVYHPEQIIDGR